MEKFLSNEHQNFLTRRGIAKCIVSLFCLYTTDNPTLGLNQAIVIPVHDPQTGAVQFNKYRRNPAEGNVKPKYLFEPGGTKQLYGLHQLIVHTECCKAPKHTIKVIITEGELDTLVCWSANYTAVSTTNGSSCFEESWRDQLKDYDIYICYDNDEPGHRGAIKLLDFFPTAKVILLPHELNGQPVKDISDYVTAGGTIDDMIKLAEPYDIDQSALKEKSDKIAQNWGDNVFHKLLITHRKARNSTPDDITGKNRAYCYQGDDNVRVAKEIPCHDIAGIEWHPFGSKYKTKCMWHDDSDPSMVYYPQKNNCYCFACGTYADPIDLYMKVNNIKSFKKAVKEMVKEHK